MSDSSTPHDALAVPQHAAGVTLPPDELAKLDEQVAGYVGDLAQLDTAGDDFRARVTAMDQLGNAEIAQSAAASNRLLDRPMRAMQAGGVPGSGDPSRALSDLRATVESLDPGKRGDLLAPRRLLGVIPFGNRLRRYFDQYQSSQTHLNAIIESLYRSKDELLRDNAAIEEQRTQLQTMMQRLQAMIYLTQKIDAKLQQTVNELESTDPARADLIKREALFPVRQKNVDLLTQMAVNAQGSAALDLIRKNNSELVKGVDRATTTTVSALRTAVATAQALTSQRLVLGQIQALGTTTSNLIESTSQMLKDQSAGIYEQATQPTVRLEQLHNAFENVYAAMDSVEDYKRKAAGALAQTASALQAELARAQERLPPPAQS